MGSLVIAQDNFGVSEEDLGAFNELEEEAVVDGFVENFEVSNNDLEVENVQDVEEGLNNDFENAPIQQINFGNQNQFVSEEFEKSKNNVAPMSNKNQEKIDLSAPVNKSADTPMTPVANDSSIDLENASPAENTVTEEGFIEQIGDAPVDSGVEAIRQDQLVDIPSTNDFAGVPAVPGTRRNLVSGEAPEVYFAEMGDTLYDICDQLLDEPGYWPKLWALNPEIKNPHFIYPGMRIKFFPGDTETPPYMQVIEELSVEPVEVENLTAAELESQDPSKLLIDNAEPETFELLDASQIDVGIAGEDFQVVGADAVSVDTLTVQLPAILTQEEITPLARVQSGWSGESYISQGKNLFIEVEEGEVPPKRYSIIRSMGQIQVDRAEGFAGYRYEIIGSLNVLGASAEDGVVKAKTNELREIAKAGDLVVPYIATESSVPLEQSTVGNDVEGAMVVGLESHAQSLAIAGSLAIVNKKLAVGTEVNVYSVNNNIFQQNFKNNVPTDHRKSAKLYIFHSNGYTSTGFIAKSSHAIRIGDPLSPGSG